MKSFLLLIVTLVTLTLSHVVKPRLHSDEFIKSINEKQSTWKAGRNFPEDTPIEQLRRLNGARRDHSNKNDIKVHRVIAGSIPESFDARTNWPQCESIKGIRNQGNCGSCWAFGAAEVMTDRLCIASNGTVKFEFSPENLVSCCWSCGDGCLGGYPSMAWKWWMSKGIVSGGDYNTNEGCQPYPEEAYQNGVTPKCESKCTNSFYKLDYSQDKHFGTSNYQIYQEVQQIQVEIMTNGPVEASYDVYDDFFDYQSGVYNYTSGEYAGGHAVKIVGWGVERDTPYWLVANSWGTKWGELGGFFKILRGENLCGIEEEINAGVAKV